MGKKLAAVILIAALCSSLLPLLAEAVPPPFLPGVIQFSKASFQDGETAEAFVYDPELNAASRCDVTWTDIPSTVLAGEWWSLATGSPHEDRFSLDPGCTFDTETPSRTPLRPLAPVWSAQVDGVDVLVGNFDPVLGRISLASAVNASSTVRTLFEFDEVNSYPATSTVARIYSDSDLVGEPVSMTEVHGESDFTPSPASAMFVGAVVVSSDPISQSLNDGAVWVRHGDTLHVDYFGLGNEDNPVSSAAASLDIDAPAPTPTPVPASSTISLAILGAAFITLTIWQIWRARRSQGDP